MMIKQPPTNEQLYGKLGHAVTHVRLLASEALSLHFKAWKDVSNLPLTYAFNPSLDSPQSLALLDTIAPAVEQHPENYKPPTVTQALSLHRKLSLKKSTILHTEDPIFRNAWLYPVVVFADITVRCHVGDRPRTEKIKRLGFQVNWIPEALPNGAYKTITPAHNITNSGSWKVDCDSIYKVLAAVSKTG